MSGWTIRSVEAFPPSVLRLALSTGRTLTVDLGAYLDSPGYESLSDPAVFSEVTLEEWGHGVEWERIDMGIDADTLYRLSREQSGKAMPVEEFNAWMSRNELSLSAAAEALGLSRRTIIYYHGGHKPIPNYIGLACKGWEVLQADKVAA